MFLSGNNRRFNHGTIMKIDQTAHRLKRFAAGLILLALPLVPAQAQTSTFPYVAVAGSFNNFNTLSPNMTLVDNNLWQADLVITNASFVFKFSTANFANNWGLNSQPHRTLPLAMTAVSGGGDIAITNRLFGVPVTNTLYRFLFNDSTREFAVFLLNNLDTNLLYNAGFESTGTSVNRARYWELNNPNLHGTFAGTAQRQGVAPGIVPKSGTRLAWLGGTWAGASFGTVWQETPAEPGVTYEASGWFQPELSNLWSAASTQMRLEFYDFDQTNLLATFTRDLTSLPPAVGSNWVQQFVAGLAPPRTAWARLVVHAEGVGPVGTFRIDDTSLRATTAKRTEDFNDWTGATIDGTYIRGGWSIVTGRTVSAYTFAGQTIPLARSGFAASLANPGAGPLGGYVITPRFNDAVGTVSFWYRHGYQGDPAENPETPVHLIVQRSSTGLDFTPLAVISNVINTEFLRFDITAPETAPPTRYIRIIHAGGSTNRLLLDDIVVGPPVGQPRFMNFNDWTNATANGNHVFGGWRLSNGVVGASLALNGLSGQIAGTNTSQHALYSPIFSNGYGTISFRYRPGLASSRTVGLALEARASGSTNWIELDRITNIATTAWQQYQRFFIQNTPYQLRIRNLAEINTSPFISPNLFEGFTTDGPPPGWTFNQIGYYTSAASSGTNSGPPSLRFDVTGASVTTPGLVSPTNIRFMILGQTISPSNFFTVEGATVDGWQLLATYSNISGSRTTISLPVSTNISQIRFTYFKPGAGNLAFDDFLAQGQPFANPNAPQNLVLDDVDIGQPLEFRLQDFNTWPTKLDPAFGTTFHQGWTLDGPVVISTSKAFNGQSASLTRTAQNNEGGGGGSDYVVDFEGPGETKTTYASGNVILNGISWNLTEVLIGTDAADFRNGVRSARFRGYGTSSMTMNADKPDGLGVLSFQYRRYGTDAQTTWRVEASTNAGSSWFQVGDIFTAGANVATFNATVNIEDPIRIRIRENTGSGTSNRRMNVDDIVLSGYTGGDEGDLVNSSIQSHFLPDGVGPISFQYRHVLDSAPPAGSIMRAAIQLSSNGVTWVTTNTLTIANSTYQPYELFLNLPQYTYVRIAVTGGTSQALFDNIEVRRPQPPANATVIGYTEPGAPFTNDFVTIYAQIGPQFGANNFSVTSYYRIGTSGAFTAVAMTPLGGTLYEASSNIPPQPRGTIVQYYIAAWYDGPGAAQTRPAYFPTNAPTVTAFYGIPRNPPGRVWINEVDYSAGEFIQETFDGITEEEFVELAGFAGSDLSGWTVEFLTDLGAVFGHHVLTNGTTIANTTNGYGFYVLAQKDVDSPPRDLTITNTMFDSLVMNIPGVIRLLNEVGGVEDVIAYGGSVLGYENLGVVDSDFLDSFDPVPLTNSIFLTGIGTVGAEFSWASGVFSAGSVNPGQTFAQPAVIFASTGLLTYAYIPGSFNPPAQTIVISNAGVSPLSYDISATPGWITVSPLSGVLTSGQAQVHTVSIETAGLTGNRSGSLLISGASANGPIGIQVQALQVGVSTGLLAYSFDEGGVNNAVNGGSLGSAANLIFTNGAVRTLSGQGVSTIIGDFAYLGSLSTGLARSASAVTGLNNRSQFTLTGWMRPSGTPGVHQIFGNRSGTNGFALVTAASYQELSLVAGNGASVTSTNGFFPGGVWTFYAITVDATNNGPDAVKFYYGTDSNSIFLASLQSRSNFTGTGIGTNLQFGGNGTNAFQGRLDDFRLFGGLLSPMELEAIRRQGAQRGGDTGETPFIEDNPQSINREIGQPAIFNVVASGIPLPQYQWRKFGTNIPNATISTYEISAVTAGDAGGYDVVVFNAYGSVTSEVAVLTIGGALTIVTQPQDQFSYLYGTVSFNVGISATTNVVTYQWLRNGSNVGSNNATLTLTNVTDITTPQYRVRVSDGITTLTSQVARLYIVDVELGGGAAGNGIFAPPVGTTNVVLRWPSLAGHRYDVFWTTNLMTQPQVFIMIATNLPATPSVNVYTDTVHGAKDRGFYRIQGRQSP